MPSQPPPPPRSAGSGIPADVPDMCMKKPL